MKRAAGFTLVELLVAISILALVAVLGWRGLDGIVRARVALTEQMENTRGMQLAFAQMQSDAEHLATTQVLHGRPELAADSGRLTLVREVLEENEPSRLQVVAYRVVDEVLTRRESIGTRDLVQLDVLWKAATSDADTTPAVTLQNGVAGLTVRAWEGNAWRAAGTGATPAPATTGLEVALQGKGQQIPMTKVFLLGGR